MFVTSEETRVYLKAHIMSLHITQWPEALMEGVGKIGMYISEKAPRKVYKNAKRL